MGIKEDIEYIRAALAGGLAPFISSLLARPRIVASEKVEIAGVDSFGTMYINPISWENLSVPDKVYVAAHEAVHLAFWHPGRRGTRDPKLWNLAADSVTWVILRGLIRAPMENTAVSPKFIARICGKEEKEIERMAVEEIYNLLIGLKKVVLLELTATRDDLLSNPLAGEVIQEGDPGTGDPENWKVWVAQAEILQRNAGTVPAGLERAIRDLLLPDVDPKALIRGAIRVGLGKVLASDWKKRSKRYLDLPGIKGFTVPEIWALVDTSGSISEDDLKLELGTVYEFSRMAKIHTICFDAQAYEEILARNPSEVISVVAKKLKGGGGTMIRGALEKTLERMGYKDVILVLTDGHIYDLDEVQPLLQVVAGRASLAAFLSLDHLPAVPGWRVIKIRRKR